MMSISATMSDPRILLRQCIFHLLCTLMVSASAQLEIMNQWSFLKYNAPFNYPVGNYLPENTVFTGLEVGWDRVFLSTPRLWPGNPATVSWIPRNSFENSGEMSPPLQAYPSWDWHRAATTNTVSNTKENCTNIISVFRIRLDKCDRLWILDSGVMDSLMTFTVVCPPKLLIFDSRTDQLIRIVTFPPEILRRNSLLTNMVIDDNTRSEYGVSDCDNVFVYMTDSTNPALVVYDARKDSAWRISSPLMFPDPDFGTYKVAGESFTLMDGIIGIALSAPILPHKQLYFQPFASNRIFTVPTSVLKAGPNPGDDGELPVSLVGHKSSQAAPLAVEPRDGALIFSPVSETAIATWIPGSSDHGVLAYDPELLQFPLDIRVSERDNGNIWLITTKFQKFFRKTVNSQDFNLRILRIKRPVEPLYGHNNRISHGLMGTTSELMTLAFSIGMGYLTKILPTEEFWKTVFLLSATLNIIPSALFTIWGSAELQPWNRGPKYYRNGVDSQEKHSERLNKLTDNDKPVLC